MKTLVNASSDIEIAPWARDLSIVVDQKRFLCPPPTIKILMVVDGSIGFNRDFGLGYIVQTLSSNALGYVKFEVSLATRESSILSDVVQRGNQPTYEPDYTSFLFNRSEENDDGDTINTIDKYDQIWMFGLRGESSLSLTPPELSTLHTWMDNGGSVLAMGDHDDLGAAMCKDIQRVRHMRRWTRAQGVPPGTGLTRHDTNRPANAAQRDGIEFMPFSVEEDNVLQPLEWRRYPLNGIASGYQQRVAPHPILCDPVHGVLDVFPDHPHEGDVFDDSEVITNAANTGDFPSGPMPQTIAWVRTWIDSTNREKGQVNYKRFGALGVYDGQPAGVGRIVVDSTWHHWLTINLLGMERASASSTNYARFQTFVRNVAIWLASAEQKKEMLCAGTWLTLFTPEVVENLTAIPDPRFYELARDVLGRTASNCQRLEWLFPWIPIEVLRPPVSIDDNLPFPVSCLTCPPWEFFESEILQGIMEAWQPLALEVLDGKLEQLPLEQVTNLFEEGAQLGRQRAVESWQRSIEIGFESVAQLK